MPMAIRVEQPPLSRTNGAELFQRLCASFTTSKQLHFHLPFGHSIDDSLQVGKGGWFGKWLLQTEHELSLGLDSPPRSLEPRGTSPTAAAARPSSPYSSSSSSTSRELIRAVAGQSLPNGSRSTIGRLLYLGRSAAQSSGVTLRRQGEGSETACSGHVHGHWHR